jgi:hypothetical protein
MYRKNVSRLRNEVWDTRNGCDAYTGSSRNALAENQQNVDHVLEVQLVHFAAEEQLSAHRGLAERMCEVVNKPINLNVTSREINQAKKGPFTAALNRLRKKDGCLRPICVEQLARSGRAKWLVDQGHWSLIEKEVVLSYDAVEESLQNERLTRAHAKALTLAMENLHATLEKLQLM